jgi:molecular chaperone GrpE
MTDEPRKVPIKVSDKRRSAEPAAGEFPPQAPNRSESPSGETWSSPVPEDGAGDAGRLENALEPEEAAPLAGPPDPDISVEELQRIKADLENDRKRMIREQSRALQYASRDLIKRMLPVIDHLRLALEHGEGGPGVELAFKELLDVLAVEGLEEIDVEIGEPFDPKVHHALSSQPDPSVETDTVAEVTRRGYRFKDHILRSPEVVVAQPASDQESIEG